MFSDLRDRPIKVEWQIANKNDCSGSAPSDEETHADSSRDPESMKKENISKTARMKGLPYQTRKRYKANEGRTLKPACNCKRGCFEKVTEVDRLIIFDDFWRNHGNWDQKRKYIAERVTKIEIKRRTVISDNKRTCNLRYSLRVNEEDIFVCQTMFLNTLDIRDNFVRYTINKKIRGDGFAEPDMRGKKKYKKISETVIQSVKDHISSYIGRNSRTNQRRRKPHYCIVRMYEQYKEEMEKKGKTGEQCAKSWLYYKLAKSQLNTASAPVH